MIIRDFCHGDQHLASLFFYRVAMRKPESILPYLIQGLTKGGYIWEAHITETTEPKAVRAWVQANITDAISGHKRGRGPEPMRAALKAMLKAMLDNLK